MTHPTNSGKERAKMLRQIAFQAFESILQPEHEFLTNLANEYDLTPPFTDAGRREEDGSKCTLSDLELCEAIDKFVSKQCKTGKAWQMTVPVDFNRDSDMLITELVQRFKARVEVKEEDQGELWEEIDRISAGSSAAFRLNTALTSKFKISRK